MPAARRVISTTRRTGFFIRSITQATYRTGQIGNCQNIPSSAYLSTPAVSILAYDALGRVTASQQVTAGQTYNFGYSWDLSGALIFER
jgi:hypothetical protein